MAFSENVKQTVREWANYTCCWCLDRKRRIEIHHIIPQVEGGPDTIDNAAPLCASCHFDYGDNTSLRKEIRDRRDLLYRRNEVQKPRLDRFMELVELPERWFVEYIDDSMNWFCDDQKLFQIIRGNRDRDFSEPWTRVYPAANESSAYKVYLLVDGVKLKELTFISCDGGRIFVPIPGVRTTNSDEVIYYWEINSPEFKLGKLVGSFYIYGSIEAIAHHSGIILV